MIELFLARYIYLFVLVLLAVGLYAVLAKSDLVKKVIGLTIYSTAIYLFFIEGSVREGGVAPVLVADADPSTVYVDPLPHLLILTAIVVGVGVVGVALALLVRLYRTHGTLDEDVIAARLAGRSGRDDEGGDGGGPADGDGGGGSADGGGGEPASDDPRSEARR